MVRLGEHFRRDERSRHSEWLRQRQWFIKAKEDKERRERLEEQVDDDLGSLAMSAVAATTIEIERFEAKLDSYDEATVIALMENQEALDFVNTQISALLDRAYVIEDGRRVFKSQDGSFVIDENGENVTRDEVDFDAIGPDRPTAEEYLHFLGRRNSLVNERSQIIEYQEKVDAARERIAEGDITKDELDELDAELADVMPPSVKAHVPGMNQGDEDITLKTEFSSKARSQELSGEPHTSKSIPHRHNGRIEVQTTGIQLNQPAP